jgi:cellulose biosynthesis protein BcsQ
MKIIAVINYKGGVGKTTVTANLAAGLAFRNYNVLLIDLDPQASLTFSFIKPKQWETDFAKSKTIKNWFDRISKGELFDIKPFISQTKYLDIPVFDSYIKENKTIFAPSQQYGVPVSISSYTTPSHQSVVSGIEEFITEFQKKLGLEV